MLIQAIGVYITVDSVCLCNITYADRDDTLSVTVLKFKIFKYNKKFLKNVQHDNFYFRRLPCRLQ